MELRLEQAWGERLERVKALYARAFPDAERKPFGVMLKGRERGQVDIWALLEGENFAGLAILAVHQELALLDYLAVEPDGRGRGIGGQALELVKGRYRGKTLILEVEEPGEKAGNQAQRLKRMAFYRRWGYKPTGLRVKMNGVDMILLSQGTQAPFERYLALYRQVFGEEAVALIQRNPGLYCQTPEQERCALDNCRQKG